MEIHRLNKGEVIMKRCLRERVEDKFIKLLEANGQRWVELNMKNGDKVLVRRKGYAPLPKYHWDKWEVIVNDLKVDTFEYRELIDYLTNYGK